LEKESYSVITNCVLKLKKALKKDIDDKVNSYLNDRRKKHPLEYPSCGSVFKNPKNKKAWEIIKNLGLSGFKINGAMVSDKHTNFIINKGGASSKDIVSLINYIKDKAKKELSIEMNEEVKII
jgi:UDP-N-acetylmuramate dehydrogenase